MVKDTAFFDIPLSMNYLFTLLKSLSLYFSNINLI